MPMKYVCILCHPLIARGTCPRCAQPVVDGQLRTDVPLRDVVVRQWNIKAMMQALESPDRDVRTNVISNLLCEGTVPEETFSVLRRALTHPDPDVRFLAFSTFQMLAIQQGNHLSQEQADDFERKVEEHPDDPALRFLLLGHYSRVHGSEWASERRLRHALWVIEHMPEAADVRGPMLDLSPYEGPAVEEARRLWLRHAEVRCNEPNVLGNAAFFFHLHGRDFAGSEALLKRAQSLEPDNSEWGKELARLYSLQKMDTKAFAERENAYRRETNECRRLLMLPELAETAYSAGEWDKAHAFATELVQRAKDPDDGYYRDGSAVFHGNTILGRLALRSGDVTKATAYLLESAKTTGEPEFGGPDMNLAKELLERGEREAVVKFLTLCTKFWQTDDHRPEQWIYAIEHGEIPDFRYNLR